MNRFFHDGVLRRLPLWLIVTMLNTSVLAGILVFRQLSQPQISSPPQAQLLIILWLSIVLYMLVGNVHTRCYRIEMTLPISSLTIWCRHFAAVLLGGSLVLAGSIVVVALHNLLLNRVGRLAARAGRVDAVDISYLPVALPLLSGLILAISLIDSLAPGQWKLGGRRSYWIRTIASLAVVLALLLLLQSWPWISGGICLALAVVVIRRTLRSLPSAYRLVPLEPIPGAVEGTVAITSSERTGPTPLYRTLFSIIHTCPPWRQATSCFYLFVAFMGVILAGGFERWFEVQSLRFLYIPFGSYMLFAGIGLITFNLFRLDPLPISRRSLFAVIMLPGLIAFCGGYAAGRFLLATGPSPDSPVDYRISSRGIWVDVEPRFMSVTFDGQPPTLESPWGESHQAWHLKPFNFAPLLTYNSYNTVEETSADFEALMTSRAIEAIYDKVIPPEEIRERYFVVVDERVVGLKENGFTLLADYPGLHPPPKGPETPVYMVLVLVPWLLCSAFFLHSIKATSSDKHIRHMYWIGLVILIGAMLGQVVLSVFGVFDEMAARTILAIFIGWLGTSPVSSIATWLVSLLAIAACYRFAQGQFESSEIPATPINSLLVDWDAKD